MQQKINCTRSNDRRPVHVRHKPADFWRLLPMEFLVLFLFWGTFLTPQLAAAQAETADVVYLKDGGILRGKIVGLNDDDYLKIEITGGNIFVVMMGDVEEIASEPITRQRNIAESGYMNRTGFEILSGQDSRSARFYMVNGYRFNPWFSGGIGIGLTPYNDPLTLIPLFFDANVRFLDKNASPFFFLKFGYNITSHHDDEVDVELHRGGLLFNLGVGLQFNTSRGYGWFMNAGYNIDNSYYEFNSWGTEIVENDLSFRRVNFGIGFSF